MSERQILRYGFVLAVLAILWLCGGCAMLPEQLRVHGTLTKVEHDQRYEAPCTITIKTRDKNVCDVPPVCCAYRGIVVDSTGKRTQFLAFWPRFVPGLLGLVPLMTDATFTLEREPVIRFSQCNGGGYGCPTELWMVLARDESVSK